MTILNFRMQYKTTVIKTVWYWGKKRQIDLWNRIKSPEILDPHKYNQLMFSKGAKAVIGADCLLNKWCRI